jgi:PhoH-like ATPase
MYKGVKEIDLNPEQIDSFYKNRGLELDGEIKCFANQYLIMKDKANPNHSAIGRFDEKAGRVVPLISPAESVWGIHPRNMEQSFAFDALLNDEMLFVSLVGKAGTGKTLLALAAGLHKTLDEGRFQRLLVSRPIFPMGRDIGYLPGDVEQKLNPWMQPIFDNVEFLLGADKKAAGRAQELINQGMLNIEPLTYIRGRSIPSQYLIVDESQNLTPHEIKTIVTRAGEGTKIVLTGDCYQIDNPYVDSANSGLTYAVERFKGQLISAHVTLTKGERSELAELASNIL